MTLTSRQQAIKDDFIRLRNTWAPQWESILRVDDAFLDAYLQLSIVPQKHNRLDDKVREFIYIAINASSTHLFLPGVAMHLKAAVALGASRAELMEVLELAGMVGIHAFNVGIEALLETLNEEGTSPISETADGLAASLRQRFVNAHGYWDATWDALARIDPDFFDAWLAFSAIPMGSRALQPKVKELVLCAVDAAATHLYRPGIKTHMRNALRYGATAAEIVEMLEIVSVIGIHGTLMATPMLEVGLQTPDDDPKA